MRQQTKKSIRYGLLIGAILGLWIGAISMAWSLGEIRARVDLQDQRLETHYRVLKMLIEQADRSQIQIETDNPNSTS